LKVELIAFFPRKAKQALPSPLQIQARMEFLITCVIQILFYRQVWKDGLSSFKKLWVFFISPQHPILLMWRLLDPL
jgi:hypothetical protein